MLEKYYSILGVSQRSGLTEVKKAFRLKAKELHPDLNGSPNAHEEFVLLLQAYEFLVNRLTGKIYLGHSTVTKRYPSYQRWQDCEAARARHRAEYYSRKRYEVFTDSDYYKDLTSLNVILGYAEFFVTIAFLILLPAYLTYAYSLYGFGIAMLAVLITLPITIPVIRSRPPINITWWKTKENTDNSSE